MQVIGFNLNKILAECSKNSAKTSINTNIEFIEVEKEKIEILKENESIKFSFTFVIKYTDPEKSAEENKQGEIRFEGDLLLSVDNEESKEIIKAWKKKEVLETVKIPLINFILKKCSVKALGLEEDLNLPHHIPFPQVRKDHNKL